MCPPSIAFARTLSLGLISALVVACSSSKPPPAPVTPPSASGSAAVDLRMICDEAKVAATRDAFAASVERQLVTAEGRNIFKAAGQVADDQKNATIKQGAAEVGVADWDCGAPLEKLYGKQAVTAP